MAKRLHSKQVKFNSKFIEELAVARQEGMLDSRNGQAAFRAGLLHYAEKEMPGETPTSNACAAAMYNKARKWAISEELLEETEIGRRSPAYAKPEEEEPGFQLDPTIPWTVVNKETREASAQEHTRAKAYILKDEESTVVKTETLVA